MAAILAAILEALNALGIVNSIVLTIRGLLIGDQLQKDLVTAEEQIALMYGILTNGTYGNPAIATAIASLTPITLPTVPPPGYGSDVNDTAAAVWGYGEAFPGLNPAYYWLSHAGKYAIRSSANVLNRASGNGLFFLSGWLADLNGYDNTARDPAVNTDSILADDTCLSWLSREEPDWIWDYWLGSELIGGTSIGSPDQPTYVCIFTKADFYEILVSKGFIKGSGAPIWPGLANVILGTPVALTPSLSITADMDGVLVQALTPSAPKPTTNFGGINNYRAVGGLSFLTDDGEAETIQALGFENQVYVPLTMSHASGVIFKCDTTVDATVTPWTLA